MWKEGKGKGSVGILNWIWGFRKFLAFDTTHCMSLFFFFFLFLPDNFLTGRLFNLAEGMLGL